MRKNVETSRAHSATWDNKNRFRTTPSAFTHAMRFQFFVLTGLLLADAIWWWRARQFLRKHTVGWRMALAFFCLFQAFAAFVVVLGRSLSIASQVWMPRPLIALAYLWHFLLLPALLVAILAERFWIRVRPNREPLPLAMRPLEPSDGGWTRREFLSAGLVSAPAIVASEATGFCLWQLEHFRTRRMVIEVPQLPPALDGLTIAHVADLHIGRFEHGAILERVVQTTNDLQADLIAVTGDLIDYSLDDLPAAFELVESLRSRFGTFVCEGNHDVLANRNAFRKRTLDRGITLLCNETAEVTIRGHVVQMLGLRWGSDIPLPQRSDRAIAHSMEQLLPQKRPDAFPILLAHHPHAFDYTDSIPLTLSGHTHGGQLMLAPHVGIGPLLFRYWSGLYARQNRSLVVSNGVGNWFPLRCGAPAEIVHLTLRAT